MALAIAAGPAVAQTDGVMPPGGTTMGRTFNDPRLADIIRQRTDEISALIGPAARLNPQAGQAPGRGQPLPGMNAPMTGSVGVQQAPLSPAEQQRLIQRQQAEAEEAGDPEFQRRRPLPGRGRGFALGGLIDESSLEEEVDDDMVDTLLGWGNSSLWPGVDGVETVPDRTSGGEAWLRDKAARPRLHPRK